MAGKKTGSTRLIDFSSLIYDFTFRSFWLGSENDFRQGRIELLDLAVHESTLWQAV